ncbi:GNAT family N-acetyltransferase [Acetivibrio ethanolgignens]|uniref:N-acetyltransferase domain-containing protein n=1 Tax=Acetivibrio ethanolgignens TaxID=290052 RepID=A0A0V8QID8_9FIRM|nr:GNAT family protein [Acetivibrio ethanolgignens]KSV60238.1 hypothetical protein ASU35_17210 [Acetivibrio ethanolgignens]
MKCKNANKQFEIVKKEFPIHFSIGDKKFFVNLATVIELEELREKGNFDRRLMTCRPIIEKTKEEHIALFSDLVENNSNLLLGIYHKNGKETEIIGRISFYDNNPRNKSVEMGYLLTEIWQGNGIMRTSLLSVIEKLFGVCDLNKIYAQTCELNTRSRNLLEKCGFCVDARLRQHHEYNSFFYDDYIYSILRDDYMLHGGLDEDV